MLIDWFTVGAQVVNFVVLVWLLKRFLYKPILAAIDAREKRIASELAKAESKQKEADSLREAFQTKSAAFDAEREAVLRKATDDASAERGRLLEEARKAAVALRDTQQRALKSDLARIGADAARLTADEVFRVARKALADLATTSLEERMAAVLTRRLRELNGEPKEALAVAVRMSGPPAVVRSAFALPDDQRAVIRNALNETFAADVRVTFETHPDVICGIELVAHGQKLAWSIDEYLTMFGRKVQGVLDGEASAPGSQPVVAPPPPPPPPAEPKGTPSHTAST